MKRVPAASIDRFPSRPHRLRNDLNAIRSGFKLGLIETYEKHDSLMLVILVSLGAIGVLTGIHGKCNQVML